MQSRDIAFEPRTGARRLRTRGERGWALVSVLWTIAVLAMLAAAAQSLAYSSAAREHRALVAAQTDALLDAAVLRAVLGIADPRPDKRWPVDGTPQTARLNGVDVRVAVQDELGRIDLNAADGSLFKQLLQSAGESGPQSDVLTQRILDWRMGGDDAIAGDAAYATAGLPIVPATAPSKAWTSCASCWGCRPRCFSGCVRP